MLALTICTFIFGCGSNDIPNDREATVLNTDYVLGSSQAPVKLIEYGDLECELCATFHQQVFQDLKQKYVDTGKLSYEFRNFPIVTVNANAFDAAQALYCAGDQGKYWEFLTRAFAFQDNLKFDDLADHAKSVGVDNEKLFTSCLNGKKYAEYLEKQILEAAKLELRGVPTFYINDQRIDGVESLNKFEDLIEQNLNSR